MIYAISYGLLIVDLRFQSDLYGVVPFSSCHFNIVAPFLFNMFMVTPYLACSYIVMPGRRGGSYMFRLDGVVMPCHCSCVSVESDMVILDHSI